MGVRMRESILNLPNTENDQNTWWDLDPATREIIKSMVPDQEAWTLDCYRTEGIWQFSLPEFQTFNEALVNGTEKSVDWHFIELGAGIPKKGSHMRLTCYNGDVTEPEEYTTKLKHICSGAWDGDPSSNWYYDIVSGKDCWLCPYLQVLFKCVPKTLYVQMKPTPDHNWIEFTPQ